MQAGLDGGFRGFTGAELLSLYSLTHIYSQHWFYGGMSQSWTLAVEITFYLMLPAYALLMRKLGAGADPMRGCDSSCRARSCSTWPASVGARSCSTAGCSRRSHSTGCRDTSTSSVSAWRSRPCTRGRRTRAVASRCSSGSVSTPTCAWESRSACYVTVALALDLPRGIIEVTGPRGTRGTSCTRSSRCSCSSPRCSGRRTARSSATSSGGARWCMSASCRTACTSGTTPFSSRRESGPASRCTTAASRCSSTITMVWSVIFATASYYLVELPILRLKDRPLFRRAR